MGPINLKYLVVASMLQCALPFIINAVTNTISLPNTWAKATFYSSFVLQFAVFFANIFLFNVLAIMAYNRMNYMETLFTMIDCYSRGYYQVKS